MEVRYAQQEASEETFGVAQERLLALPPCSCWNNSISYLLKEQGTETGPPASYI